MLFYEYGDEKGKLALAKFGYPFEEGHDAVANKNLGPNMVSIPTGDVFNIENDIVNMITTMIEKTPIPLTSTAVKSLLTMDSESCNFKDVESVIDWKRVRHNGCCTYIDGVQYYDDMHTDFVDSALSAIGGKVIIFMSSDVWTIFRNYDYENNVDFIFGDILNTVYNLNGCDHVHLTVSADKGRKIIKTVADATSAVFNLI